MGRCVTESAVNNIQSTGRKPADLPPPMVRRLAPAALIRRARVNSRTKCGRVRYYFDTP